VSGHRTTKAIKKGFVYPANATVKKGAASSRPSGRRTPGRARRRSWSRRSR